MNSWDQFQVNTEKFGINFNFQEENYTTKLDMSQVNEDLKMKAVQIENVNNFFIKTSFK